MSSSAQRTKAPLALMPVQNEPIFSISAQQKVILILLSDSLTTTDLLMARKAGPTIAGRVVPTPDEPAREELDDARLLDLDVEQESPFLRGQKRVPVRRGPLPKKTVASTCLGGCRSRARSLLRHRLSPLFTTTASIPGAFGLIPAMTSKVRPAERHPRPDHGGDGRRHWPQHFLHPSGPAPDAARSDSVGRIRQRDALRRPTG